MEMSSKSKNVLRTEIRTKSKFSELIFVSQQTSSLDECKKILSGKISRFQTRLYQDPLSHETIACINNLGLQAIFQIFNDKH